MPQLRVHVRLQLTVPRVETKAPGRETRGFVIHVAHGQPGLRNTTMLPLLKLVGDGSEHVMAAAIAALADEFQLTAEQRAELLPGGSQRRFRNRPKDIRDFIGSLQIKNAHRGVFIRTSTFTGDAKTPPQRAASKSC